MTRPIIYELLEEIKRNLDVLNRLKKLLPSRLSSGLQGWRIFGTFWSTPTLV